MRYVSYREVLGKAQLHAEGDVAKRLHDTNVWRAHRSKSRAKITGDKTRVNITSDKLCGSSEEIPAPSPPSLGLSAKLACAP